MTYRRAPSRGYAAAVSAVQNLRQRKFRPRPPFKPPRPRPLNEWHPQGDPEPTGVVETSGLALDQYRNVWRYHGAMGTELVQPGAGGPGPTGPQGPQGEQGPRGTGLSIRGELDDPSELPSQGELGDAYMIAGNLWVWTGEAWENVGTIKGPTGPVGEAGPVGATGPQGAVGAIGPIGPAGPVGEAGPVGAVGPQGAVGAIGPMGPQGANGGQGPTGPQGVVGPVGPQGPAGNVDYSVLQNYLPLTGGTVNTLTVPSGFGGLNVSGAATFTAATSFSSAGNITMSGTTRLTLAGDATANLQAVPLQQVNSLISTATGNYLPLAGGSLSGVLNVTRTNSNIDVMQGQLIRFIGITPGSFSTQSYGLQRNYSNGQFGVFRLNATGTVVTPAALAFDNNGGGNATFGYGVTLSGNAVNNLDAVPLQQVQSLIAAGAPRNYTTSEQDTGLTWIDGRAIYQRTFSFAAPAADAQVIQAVGAVVNTVVSSEAIVTSFYASLALPYLDSSGNRTSFWVQNNENNIYVESNWNTGGRTVYVTLKYTKP